MNEFKILMGKDQMDFMDALLQNQINPSEENKKRVDELSAENTRKIKEGHDKNANEFISEHGQELFDFVSSFSEENFLFTKNRPFYLTWFVADEEQAQDENDNYWKVTFYKGQFNYVKDICGGYAGTEILEENISQERVLELINTKNLKAV